MAINKFGLKSAIFSAEALIILCTSLYVTRKCSGSAIVDATMMVRVEDGDNVGASVVCHLIYGRDC